MACSSVRVWIQFGVDGAEAPDWNESGLQKKKNKKNKKLHSYVTRKVKESKDGSNTDEMKVPDCGKHEIRT